MLLTSNNRQIDLKEDIVGACDINLHFDLLSNIQNFKLHLTKAGWLVRRNFELKVS